MLPANPALTSPISKGPLSLKQPLGCPSHVLEAQNLSMYWLSHPPSLAALEPADLQVLFGFSLGCLNCPSTGWKPPNWPQSNLSPNLLGSKGRNGGKSRALCLVSVVQHCPRWPWCWQKSTQDSSWELGAGGQAEMLYLYFHVIKSGSPTALEVTAVCSFPISPAFVNSRLQGSAAALIRAPLLTCHFWLVFGWNSLGLVGLVSWEI